MSPPDPSAELARLLGADLARRCVEACAATGLSHAVQEEEVELPGGRSWHVAAAYDPDADLVRIDGHTHVEAPSLFSLMSGQPPEGFERFALCLPAAWLPRVEVPAPRGRECGARPTDDDPTAMPGTTDCGLRPNHEGPHSWQPRGADG